jgi:hypothetical protein
MTPNQPLPYATVPVRPDLVPVLQALRPGQRVRITQTVRVGMKTWPATVVGTFRHIDSLATGLATDRVPVDDIIVPIIHFTKDTGELSSVAVDENTQVEVIDAATPAVPPPPGHALPADANPPLPPPQPPSPLTTKIIRDIRGCSHRATARLSMLNPRDASMPEMWASTPGWSWTRAESRCCMDAPCGRCQRM